MKKKILNFLIILITASQSGSFASGGQQGGAPGWKAGVARVVITPSESMWLAGYGSRDHPSEGTLVDLWSKALALEDANGKRAILITNDLVKIPKNISDRIRDRIGAKYGLTRAQIILNSSHTHSGPVLYNNTKNQYNLDEIQNNKVIAYSEKYEKLIIDLVDKAFGTMVPAKLYSQNGITRFAVNRRNNVENELTPLTELKGPDDYAVPVIKVTKANGELMALVFGYACHNTVLGIYKWSGDYAGFAQIELEKSHPGTTALFFQGAGADQNPLPRSTVALAQQYGRELASAVERVLDEEMKPLSPQLSTAYSEVALPYTDLPSKEQLTSIAQKNSSYPSWHKQWASEMLGRIAKGEEIPKNFPYYPCQVWKLGDQPIMSLGGELVVGYDLRLKQIFGQDIFVMGYCNDVVSYIPTVTILKEGGYEGIRSQLSSGWPGTYKPEIESIIIDEMVKLAKQAGVPQVSSQLRKK